MLMVCVNLHILKQFNILYLLQIDLNIYNKKYIISDVYVSYSSVLIMQY